MKKIFFLLAAVVLTCTAAVQAQGGGMQRRTVEENVKLVMEKLADLKLDKDQTARTETTFTDYFKSRDKMFEESRGDRSQMREKMTKLNEDRDEKLKKVFNEAQYKKWKDEIEPSLRPQRGPGGPGGGGQRQ